MATSTQLQRIAILSEKLDPIAKKQRGMRIEAEEWNLLIEVLLGVLAVDRAQEDSTQVALEQRFAVKEHEHPGQVGLTWLDSDLQSRIGGGESSVPTRIAISEMEKKLQSLGSEVARLTSLTEQQQKLLDRATVEQTDRSTVLQQFEARFAGLENLRTLVTTVSSDVGGMRANVNTLLELRKSLSDPQGNPIDVSKLQADLTDLQGLRDNLKGVDGQLIRVRDFEIKLKEISDATGLGGQGGLDARLASLSNEMEGRLNIRIEERNSTLRQSLQDENAARDGVLRGELNALVTTQGQTLSRSLDGVVAASETRLNASLDDRIAASTDAIRTAAVDATQVLLDARLAGLPDRVRTLTQEGITTLRADLSNELRTSLVNDLQTRSTTFEAQVNTRLSATESKVSGFEQQLPGLVVERVDSARSTLEQTLLQNISVRFDAAQGTLQDSLRADAARTVTETIGDLDGRINNAVTTRLDRLDETVASAVTVATRNLPDQINAEVRTQLTAVDVDGKIGRANAVLAQQLRSEQALALAQQRAQTTDAINSNASLLRGEMGALRNDFDSTINTRISQSSAQ